MEINVVNLDRSPDRLQEFIEQNGALPVKFLRWSAVDGSAVDIDALVTEGILDRRILATYTAGALGSALSHLGLWRRAVETQQPLTLCEDDAIFNHDFPRIAEAVIAQLPADWDIILWGWNFDAHLTFNLLPGVSTCTATFDQEAARGGVEQFVKQQIGVRVYRLMRAFGMPCYTVSCKGAQLLRRHCLPLRPMSVFYPGLKRMWPNTAIDVMASDLYPQIKAFVSLPPLVITKNEHRISTIQTGKTLASPDR